VDSFQLRRSTYFRPLDHRIGHWQVGWHIGQPVSIPAFRSLVNQPTSPFKGWHYSVWDYRGKIKRIVKTMFSMLDSILPINRRLVYGYIENYSFGRVELLLRSIIPYDAHDDDDLRENIQPYLTEEEERLRSTLESIAWDIDTMDTLALITGPERIEKVRMLVHNHSLRLIFGHFLYRSSFLSCT
jgi:hypothetical protein